MGTEIKNEKELNANRQMMEETLRGMFGDSGGKLDLNNSSVETLADALREPLLHAGVPLSEQELQEVATQYRKLPQRAAQGGLLKSFDQLSGVPGVTPQVIARVKEAMRAGSIHDSVGRRGGSEDRRGLAEAGDRGDVVRAGAGCWCISAFRFEWIYGVAAVVAVFHDTLITIGLFSLFNKEISLTVVAALLTLVGYSMNDTIVVFDRIRENLKILRREKLEHLINISVNQTLSRTVLTSGLTLLPLCRCGCSAARC